MYDVCVIGHITRDLIRIKDTKKEMPGGVAYYFTTALRSLGSNVCLITKLTENDIDLFKNLVKNGIKVVYSRSEQSTIFENVYSRDLNSRTQHVYQVARPFTIDDIPDISAQVFHLGPLTREDIPMKILRMLSKKSRISLDAHGFLRRIQGHRVKNTNWDEKDEGLTYINILKVDKREAEILSEEKDTEKAAVQLARYGIDEIIITLGNKGSLVYSEGRFHSIPAFPSKRMVDSTGCGDVYMAGYIHKRLKSSNIAEAGRFAAAMASLNLEQFGPYVGNEKDVQSFLELSSRGKDI